MIRILFVGLATVAGMTASARPVHAAEPPWCLIIKEGEEHCRYYSLETCLRDKAGGEGFCNPNPRYQGGRRDGEPRSRHSHSR